MASYEKRNSDYITDHHRHKLKTSYIRSPEFLPLSIIAPITGYSFGSQVPNTQTYQLVAITISPRVFRTKK